MIVFLFGIINVPPVLFCRFSRGDCRITSYNVCYTKLLRPFVTPWRIILIGDDAGDLVQSRTILNLNEPNVLEDVSWIKPTKYMGIWWEMHLGKNTWDMKSGRHGATTENAKQHIDFASRNNFV